MKNVKKVKNLSLVFIFLAAFGFSNVFGQEKAKDPPTLYAVMFYADECSDSKLMARKVIDLQNKLKDEKVEFLKFDFSTSESREKIQSLVKELGLQEVLTSNQGTGFVVLVDAKSKEGKAVLTTKQSLDEMLAVVKKNL